MKTFKTLVLAAVALGAVAIATPAQARDHHHHWDHGRHWDQHHYYGRSVYYGGPRYYARPYYYDDYYAPAYSYYRPSPYYYGGPSVTFAFGGSRFHHRHWR